MLTSKHAYSLAEVAQITGLSRTSIYLEIREGRLVARKVKRRTIVLATDLNSYLESRPVAASVSGVVTNG